VRKLRVTISDDNRAGRVAGVLGATRQRFFCQPLPENGSIFTIDIDGLRILQEHDLLCHPDGKFLAEWMDQEDAPIQVNYTNWKGAVRLREIVPVGLRYGDSPYHPGKQWLLEALDPEDGKIKDFSLNTCVFDLNRLPQ
jgi:hypothetical protein